MALNLYHVSVLILRNKTARCLLSVSFGSRSYGIYIYCSFFAGNQCKACVIQSASSILLLYYRRVSVTQFRKRTHFRISVVLTASGHWKVNANNKGINGYFCVLCAYYFSGPRMTLINHNTLKRDRIVTNSSLRSSACKQYSNFNSA